MFLACGLTPWSQNTRRHRQASQAKGSPDQPHSYRVRGNCSALGSAFGAQTIRPCRCQTSTLREDMAASATRVHSKNSRLAELQHCHRSLLTVIGPRVAVESCVAAAGITMHAQIDRGLQDRYSARMCRASASSYVQGILRACQTSSFSMITTRQFLSGASFICERTCVSLRPTKSA